MPRACAIFVKTSVCNRFRPYVEPTPLNRTPRLKEILASDVGYIPQEKIDALRMEGNTWALLQCIMPCVFCSALRKHTIEFRIPGIESNSFLSGLHPNSFYRRIRIPQRPPLLKQLCTPHDCFMNLSSFANGFTIPPPRPLCRMPPPGIGNSQNTS